MTTILIWLGSGFAFAVGVCVGVWLMTVRDRSLKRAGDSAQEATDLLRERNEIGKRQLAALETLAECATQVSESK